MLFRVDLSVPGPRPALTINDESYRPCGQNPMSLSRISIL